MRIAIHKQSGQPLSDSDGAVLMWETTDAAEHWLAAHDVGDAYVVKAARPVTRLEMLEVVEYEARQKALADQ